MVIPLRDLYCKQWEQPLANSSMTGSFGKSLCLREVGARRLQGSRCSTSGCVEVDFLAGWSELPGSSYSLVYLAQDPDFEGESWIALAQVWDYVSPRGTRAWRCIVPQVRVEVPLTPHHFLRGSLVFSCPWGTSQYTESPPGLPSTLIQRSDGRMWVIRRLDQAEPNYPAQAGSCQGSEFPTDAN